MALYMVQATYTTEAWAAQIKNPADVRNRLNAVAEQFGGRVHHVWYCVGEYDLMAIVEYPDAVSTLAPRMIIEAGGAVTSQVATPLFTVEEGIDAMKQAGKAAGVYSPPSA